MLQTQACGISVHTGFEQQLYLHGSLHNPAFDSQLSPSGLRLQQLLTLSYLCCVSAADGWYGWSDIWRAF